MTIRAVIRERRATVRIRRDNSTYQNTPQQRQSSGGQQQTMQAPPDSDPSGQFEAVDEDVPF